MTYSVHGFIKLLPEFQSIIKEQPTVEASGPDPQTTPTPSVSCKMVTAWRDGKENRL